jgi:hypothetical protein
MPEIPPPARGTKPDEPRCPRWKQHGLCMVAKTVGCPGAGTCAEITKKQMERAAGGSRG